MVQEETEQFYEDSEGVVMGISVNVNHKFERCFQQRGY